LPFDLVERCLLRQRDEVLITWFADEIYRFCEAPSMHDALVRNYGGDAWKKALGATGEHDRKDALLKTYCSQLESLPKVRTGTLSIASRNATARYSIILATHSDKGLECWNPVRWGLDPSGGRSVSEKRPTQDALFDDRASLRSALESRAGSAAPFGELRTEATRLGFLESQLRATLDELRADGLAVREHPLDADARSPWPSAAVVRFYAAAPGSVRGGGAL
jgi:hypothetical protein